jgi:ribonuclease III
MVLSVYMEDRNLQNDLDKLQKILNVTFTDTKVLLSAITHRSYLNEHREATWDHNERLEFLGDAVLELVVTDFLFAKYPEKPEGELTAIRAALVNTVSLAAAAEKLGVNDYLLMSKGESKDVGRARQYILANSFEACIGAIYIDQGYDKSKEFIADRLFPKTDEIVRKRLWQDAKSRFQELSQEHASITPTYETVGQSGPDHDRVFTVGVFLRQEKVAEGSGRSKQEAEQQAAERAIEAKGWETE